MPDRFCCTFTENCTVFVFNLFSNNSNTIKKIVTSFSNCFLGLVFVNPVPSVCMDYIFSPYGFYQQPPLEGITYWRIFVMMLLVYLAFICHFRVVINFTTSPTSCLPRCSIDLLSFVSLTFFYVTLWWFYPAGQLNSTTTALSQSWGG